MFKSLEILHFRGLKRLRVNGLTRVNLFVGVNNAGKTSLLEAVEILCQPSVNGVVKGPRRRNERIYIDREDAPRPLVDVSHLFPDHHLRPGAEFRIEGSNGRSSHVTCEILPYEETGQLFEADEGTQPSLTLRISSSESDHAQLLQLSAEGGLLAPSTRRVPLAQEEEFPPVQFLTTEPPHPAVLGQLWDAIVLTPEEDSVTQALRIIDPNIERIAFLGVARLARSIVIKLKGDDRRLPIGSVGDGLKRILALALHLIPAREGFLLVDEIDTGLHHTVMADMWKVVIETARRLNIQVFATTHSLDCVRALAWVQESTLAHATDVSLHRVESSSDLTTNYTLDEVAAAARHHVEVR